MTDAMERFESPYAAYPGGGPSHETKPEEGVGELWIFFFLSLANTGIIAAAGIGTWLLLGQPTL
ncbi:MAG: hypothetical protein ACREC5_08405 [Thermoplasmata archaeon]